MLDINREHPEYVAHKDMWAKYLDLYVGGERFKANAGQYLLPRQREPQQVYGERLSRVFYENYVGSIVDWYVATLFRRESVITLDGVNERAKYFFAGFTEDTDLKGTSLNDFFQRRFAEALVFGASHVLVDFPRTSGPVDTRAEEDARGVSRAYLVGYSPQDLINWSYDEQGNYEWVVLRTSHLRNPRIEDAKWVTETRWVYYDKQNYRVFRSLKEGNEPGAIEAIAEGRHGLSKQNRVPLFDLQISEGLWLMNRAGLLQLEHFNKSNALAWSLTMGLFSMPVVFSNREFQQVLGDSYYIQLAPEDRFGWTEPEGKVHEIAGDNLARLKEEIYRVCYLAQAGGSASSGATQSGLSKQRDFAITHEVLRSYGDAVKACMKRVLRAVEAAREDGLMIGVSGMDEFDISDFTSDLADAKELLGLGIESPTLKKQVFKKLASKYLCDARQDLKDQITREIDSAA